MIECGSLISTFNQTGRIIDFFNGITGNMVFAKLPGRCTHPGSDENRQNRKANGFSLAFLLVFSIRT